MRLLVCLALVGCSGVSSEPGSGELVAGGQADPTWLAQAGDQLYFVAASPQAYRVLSVAKIGGTPHELATTGVVLAIAADASGIYWLETSGAQTRVMGMAPDAAAPVVLGGNAPFNGYSLRNVIVDAQFIYHADHGGSVWQTPKLGGTSVELGKTDTSAASVALAPEGVWVATLHGAKLLPFAGGAATVLSFSTRLPDELAWDGDLFAGFGGSGAGDGTILRVPATGQPEMLVDDLVLPSSLVAAAGNLYVTTGNNDAAIRRIPNAGGEAEALANGQRPTAVVVDESFAYWTDPPRGEIRRVPR